MIRAALLVLLVACSRKSEPKQRPGDAIHVPACKDTASCETLCKGGNGEACGIASLAYFDARNGHALDHQRAFELGQRGCALGDGFSCVREGYHHQDGLATPFDTQRAIAAYEKACDKGFGVGCYNLSSIYLGGHGVNIDRAKGEAYVEKARTTWTAQCRGDTPHWCTNAAFLIATDKDGERDLDRMQELYQRACDADSLVGCVEALRIDDEREKIGKPKLRTELMKLCERGEPTACTFAALVDPKAVDEKLLERGCKTGDQRACDTGGFAAGRRQDFPKAMELFTAGCDRGNGSSCLELARFYKPDAPTPDPAKAYALLKRSCHMGYADACVYAAGMGVQRVVPMTPEEGAAYLTLGCQMGGYDSCEMLYTVGRPLPVPAASMPKLLKQFCERGIAKACTP